MSERRRSQIELHLLISLARSQRALSRMLEAAADQVEASGDLAQHIGENLGAIAAHQRALLQRVTGLPVRSRSQSAPGKPWVNAQLQLQPAEKRPPARAARGRRSR